jgi:hypothetical protein
MKEKQYEKKVKKLISTFSLSLLFIALVCPYVKAVEDNTFVNMPKTIQERMEELKMFDKELEKQYHN